MSAEFVIGTFLPAFDEGERVEESLENVKRGMEHFPQFHFKHYLLNDASNDDTGEQLNKHATNLGLDFTLINNSVNKGLAISTRDAYFDMMNDNSLDYILKTDLDADFDQEKVFEQMLSLINPDLKIAVGTRWREFFEQDHPYEFQRRTHVLNLLEEKLGISSMDPPSAGSQLYSSSFLKQIMTFDMIKNYDKRWGIDVAIPLVAASLLGKEFVKKSFRVINIENGSYDASRRPMDKVKLQYDTYESIIRSLSP